MFGLVRRSRLDRAREDLLSIGVEAIRDPMDPTCFMLSDDDDYATFARKAAQGIQEARQQRRIAEREDSGRMLTLRHQIKHLESANADLATAIRVCHEREVALMSQKDA